MALLEDPLRQPPPNAILKRVPKFMHQYVTQFANAPFSHVTAFVILHELTAIVPLVGIWYGLHNYVDHSSAIFAADLPSFAMDKASALVDKCLDLAGIAQISLQEKTRLVMEGAYSYAIVKALFPVRVMISLWGMPYFARWFVLPFTKMFSKRKPKTSENETNQLKKVESKRITKPRL
ncbi:uncharacterized protein KQ657_002032 [Scheffersomyces spartinae]|uniref:Uncharacterized protein n=1 Tax=Scheffersomyces spartinae TaxID=45513 RepID=A0A9P8AH43_9ASCO|nr:uncharacterized protein KQ657_002032 [Scheffersomyces spartinae]KAG7192313.1 hypothetical protein KQ657_002032 [Scheffersomyces spartinae]